MKKNLFRIAAVICSLFTTTMFTSCDDEEVTYKTSYMYEVRMDYLASVCYSDDARSAQSAFNQAVGTDGTNYTLYQSNKDSQMKSECESVKNRFADTQSTYMKFDLIRTAVNSAPGSTNQVDTIATYLMGQALSYPYVSYSITTNEKEAYAALEAQKGILDNTVYRASYRTLKTLLGIHSTSSSSTGTGSTTVSFNANSAFDTYFKSVFTKVWRDSQESDAYIAHACDSIAAIHTSDTLTVRAKVTVIKTGFLSKEVTPIWENIFPVTVE